MSLTEVVPRSKPATYCNNSDSLRPACIPCFREKCEVGLERSFGQIVHGDGAQRLEDRLIDVLVEKSDTSVGEHRVNSSIVATSGSPSVGDALSMVVVVDSVLYRQDRVCVHVRLEVGAVGRVGLPKRRFNQQQRGGVGVQDILHPEKKVWLRGI